MANSDPLSNWCELDYIRFLRTSGVISTNQANQLEALCGYGVDEQSVVRSGCCINKRCAKCDIYYFMTDVDIYGLLTDEGRFLGFNKGRNR